MRLVDFDTAPPPTRLRRLPTPLVLPAAGLAIGISLDNLIPLPPLVALATLVASATLVRFARRAPILRTVAVGLVFVALGAERYDLSMRRWPRDHVARFASDRPILGSIQGIILDTPEGSTPQPEAFPRQYDPPPRMRFRLDATTWIDTAGTARPASGKVLVSVTPPDQGLQPGDDVRVFGLISRIEGPANPGEFDRRKQLARDSVLVALSANTSEAVSVVSRPPRNAWRRWLRALRLRLAATLRDTGNGASDDAVGSVLDAMVLAKRSGVEKSINDAFQKTGNSHLLAASGLNVGWLALCVWLIAFPLRWYYRTTALVVLAVLLAYALLAEPNPPILRAVLMGAIACVGLIFRQRFNALNWLAASAIVLLLFSPGVLFGASFQLSYVVVLGLVLLSPHMPDPVQIIDRWRRGLSRPPPDIAAPGPASAVTRNAILEFVIDAARIGSICALTAWNVGLPLSVYHFGTVAPWGFINSFLLAPFAFVVMVLGFAKLAIGTLIPPANYLLGPLLNGVTRAMNGFVQLLASVPGTSIAVEPPSPIWVAACYAVMLLWFWQNRFRPTRASGRRVPRYAFGVAALLLVLWPLLPLRAWLRPHDRVTVSTLAVGNGTATVVELPDGRTLLYDCGSRSPYDVATRSVVPFLRYRGIRTIDYAFISHPDLDHFSGIEGVAAAIPIRRLVLNEHFEDFGADQPAVQTLLEHIRAAKISIEHVRAGWKLPNSGPASVECIWPPPAGAFITNDNSTSTVLRLSHAGRSMLLTGDIDNYALDQLTARGSLPCDAMQLPHHGSMTASTGRFLDAAHPQIAIRSSAQHDRDTTNGILGLVKGMNYFNTADDGCATVTMGPNSIDVQTIRSRAR